MQKHLVRPQFATGFQKAPFGRRTIARNGHLLRDMGVGTSRHEDDQLPCRRSRSELDPRTTRARFAGMHERQGVRFGKTGEANPRSTSTPSASVCS